MTDRNVNKRRNKTATYLRVCCLNDKASYRSGRVGAANFAHRLDQNLEHKSLAQFARR